jgi:5-methylcytosine-specific restriction protein B
MKALGSCAPVARALRLRGCPVAEVTRRRIGELQRAVFTVLQDAPDGLRVLDVEKLVEQICPPTPFENQDYAKQPGVRRFPKMIRFSTITGVKAGWLTKESGVWRLSEIGRTALAQYPDPDDFQRAALAGYKAWQADQPVTYTAEEAAEDIEAARLEAGHVKPRRAWLVRGANVDGVNMLSTWFAEGFCSINFDLPDLPRGIPKIEIAKQVKQVYPDLHIVTQGLYTGTLNRFINEMDVDDLVVTVDGSKVYVGVISDDPKYVDVESSYWHRPIKWANARSPFPRTQLSSDAADGLRGQLTVSDLTPFLTEFARLGGVELAPVEEATVSAGTIDVQLPMPDLQLADRLLMPLDWLRETVDLLNDKRQIVLYGPPGTGKTYLAQELCKALVEGTGGEYAIVQFHPSYAYEDFFEGIRPRLAQDSSGSIAFDLVHGPLRRMATLARQDPVHPYVLIIDEINRANLAKVFGELYFLLEYRGQTVQLQYSDEGFLLPRNLFFIGTMNTADRSIALVDAAMRRRFYFQGLSPTVAPVRDLLRRWLKQERLSEEPADVLEALNAAINDPDFAVGPSYLMTRRVAEPGGLERIWKTAIMPLLAEHYFGEGRGVENEFGIPTLRQVLAGHRTDAQESALEIAATGDG